MNAPLAPKELDGPLRVIVLGRSSAQTMTNDSSCTFANGRFRRRLTHGQANWQPRLRRCCRFNLLFPRRGALHECFLIELSLSDITRR